MNINLTLIAQAVTFAAFIWFTAKLIWPHLARAIDARQKHIAEGLAAAERAEADHQADADAGVRLDHGEELELFHVISLSVSGSRGPLRCKRW